jgi:hypothetical protein
LVAALLASGGCTDSAAKFDRAWPQLQGQPIEHLIGRWGRPDGTAQARENKGTVYIWNRSLQYTSTTPVTSTGAIGTTPFVVTTDMPQTDTLSCRALVLADGAKRIKSLKFSGNNGACMALAEQL